MRKINRLKNANEFIAVIANDCIEQIVIDAHMQGQISADIDPSYSNAKSYYESLFGNSKPKELDE